MEIPKCQKPCFWHGAPLKRGPSSWTNSLLIMYLERLQGRHENAGGGCDGGVSNSVGVCTAIAANQQPCRIAVRCTACLRSRHARALLFERKRDRATRETGRQKEREPRSNHSRDMCATICTLCTLELNCLVILLPSFLSLSLHLLHPTHAHPSLAARTFACSPL